MIDLQRGDMIISAYVLRKEQNVYFIILSNTKVIQLKAGRMYIRSIDNEWLNISKDLLRNSAMTTKLVKYHGK